MNYVETLKARMTDRLNFVFEKDVEDGGYNALPTQAKEALAKVIGEAHNLEVENSNNKGIILLNRCLGDELIG